MNVKKLVLIACTKKKAPHTCPVREFYRGTVFTLSVRWAEDVAHLPWAVLSAKHGLVRPRDVLEPYSLTLSKGAGKGAEVATPAFKREWEINVNERLKEEYPSFRFVALAGREYLGALRGLDYVDPLAGLQIGYRLQTLKQWIEENYVPTF